MPAVRCSIAMLLIGAVCSVLHADYAATVLEDKPFAYFRFEEPEGADELIDSSGNGQSGFEVIDVEFQREGVAGSKAAEFLVTPGRPSAQTRGSTLGQRLCQ